jgi:hypothetical protein
MEEIDICETHLNKIFSGNYIWANGAMGHNEYYFK